MIFKHCGIGFLPGIGTHMKHMRNNGRTTANLCGNIDSTICNEKKR